LRLLILARELAGAFYFGDDMENSMRFKINSKAEGRTLVSTETKSLKPFDAYTSPVLRVLGVPFGGPVEGRDAQGEAFTDKTSIWLNEGDSTPVTYYHGFGPDDPMAMQDHPAIIGMAKYTGVDERGHWFDVKLDESDPLAIRILENVETSRASSGAVGHLVRMADAGLIDVWPVGELALFDTNDWRLPANDYAVVEAKAIEIEPLQAGDATVAEVEVADAIKPLPIPLEINTMTEQIEQTPEVDYKAELEALKSEIKAMKEADPIVKSAPAVKKVTELGFKEDATKGFIHWCKTGQKNSTLVAEGETKAAWQGQTDAEGGFIVPDDFHATIVEKRDSQSWIRNAGVQIVQTGLDRYPFPTEDTAMTKFVVTAEEAAADENESTFAQAVCDIHRLTKIVKASVQVLSDNRSNLEGYLSRAFARAAAAAENYYFTIGTGNNEPQGVLTGATSSAITTAGATAITAAEMTQLRGNLAEGYQLDAIWLMQFATLNYIQGLTGNPFQFISTPQGDGQNILQRKAVTSPNMEALAATKKAVLYGNPYFYGVAERAQMSVQRLTELYSVNGQVGFLAAFRIGGVVLQSEAWKYMTQHA
jgi:HK97 family phage major capsid protein